MKPKNFPARKLARQKRAGLAVTAAALTAAQGQRSKKTPRDSWSPERSFRRRGRVS